MDISLKMLQYFKKVAETQHITNASKELYISQPQLTRVIAELERELGVTLFDREGKGIRLNPCGEAFYRYANEMLLLAERAKTTVNEVYQHELAQLTLAANVLSYLPSLLRMFREQCPDARFRQITATRDQISEMLMDRRADFGLYCFPPDTPELKSEALKELYLFFFTGTFFVVMGRAGKLRKRFLAKITGRSIEEADRILYTKGSFRSWKNQDRCLIGKKTDYSAFAHTDMHIWYGIKGTVDKKLSANLEKLKAKGYPFTCKIFEDMGHGGLVGENTERFIKEVEAVHRYAGQKEEKA